MAHINHNIISDYFKKRPQLKKPKMNQLGFEIPPEWKDFVDSLISIAERKAVPFKPQCFGELFDDFPIADCEQCQVYQACETESLT
jgi:hypothetical protein